jgi:hypothetical protein
MRLSPIAAMGGNFPGHGAKSRCIGFGVGGALLGVLATATPCIGIEGAEKLDQHTRWWYWQALLSHFETTQPQQRVYYNL